MEDGTAGAPAGGPPRILFACVENACRSQMAEAFARELGGSGVRAYSAGSDPSGSVHPLAIQVMGERGLELSDHRSTGFGELEVDRFDAVVTMGCGEECPQYPAARRVDWQIPDPAGGPAEDFRRARDEIEERVRRLLATLDLPA